jgi:nicotinate-nucleotide--dimethylbenzimidazole phosphoribosyltransferase
MSEFSWLQQAIKPMHETARSAAVARQGQLTKPPGALGQLEGLAIRLAALQGADKPQIERVFISVFAGDHGVAAEGVSAFPQAVTAEMVKNFARGGAAICVAARAIGATLEVVNLGTAFDTGELSNVRNHDLGKGTANFTQTAAMSETQLAAALAAGRDSAERAQAQGAQIYIGGEMGIANTTSAAALACALLQLSPEQLAGPGTGLDAAGVARKAEVIARALQLHATHLTDSREVLCRLGGFEIAALTGAFISCAQRGIPVLVDGYITTVAALLAVRMQPDVAAWLLYAHRSAEPGHILMLQALQAETVLQLGMRLGEGSGAAVAVPVLRMACALHNEMATFAEAGVSEKI